MQPNALLIRQNFIVIKSGCYKPTPLKKSHPQDLGSAWELFGVICSELFFMLPRCLIFRVVTPLYHAHLDYLTVSHSFYDVQDFNRLSL